MLLHRKHHAKRPARIGIYAGAFDPVHSGHVGFALQAAAEAGLDQIVFLPERMPRHKPGVEHYAHRVAMLTRALMPHPDLAVLEMVDRHFTVRRTLPALRALFPGSQLVFLMGSDTVLELPLWPAADRLLATSELVVGVRAAHEAETIRAAIGGWPTQARKLTIVDSFAPDISSAGVRRALQENRTARGLLSSVKRYAEAEWLYVSLQQSAVKPRT